LDAISETVMIFNLDDLVAAADGLDTADDSEFIMASITVGNGPYGLTLDAANNRLYVANTDDDTISVIDTLINQEITRVSLDDDDIASAFKRGCDQPFDLTVATYNNVPFVFAACFASHDVVVLNAQTLAVVEVFPNTEL
ncbi:MAG: hypothetical protein ACD_62C00296G0004, partial [uncultured bacterium]